MTKKATNIENIDTLIETYRNLQNSSKKRVVHIKLVELAMPIVKKIAVTTAKITGQSKEDLLQAGAIGLVKAIERYKPVNNAKFLTYATCMIKGEIRHYLRDKANIIKLPRNNEHDCTIISLDNPVFDEDESLIAESILSHDYKEELDAFENKILLLDAVSKLPKDLQEIINACFILDYTQKETAEKLNLTQMQVSRKLKRALNKLYSIIQDDEENSKGDK